MPIPKLSFLCLILLATTHQTFAGIITYNFAGTTDVGTIGSNPDPWSLGLGTKGNQFSLTFSYDDKSYDIQTDTQGNHLEPHYASGFLGGTLTMNGATTNLLIGNLTIYDNHSTQKGDYVYFVGRAIFNGANELFVVSFTVDSNDWSFTGDTATLPDLNYQKADFLRNYGTSGYNSYSNYLTEVTTEPTGVVPEPTSIALWGLGSLGIGVIARRRKRKQIAA